ncbi:MAG TPA: 4-aminobutyrate aminotransferase [Microvirga sp.]|jgi:hypothetical protein|nr:4-aminobutyrate aminotransferase [Microvirga sp.]
MPQIRLLAASTLALALAAGPALAQEKLFRTVKAAPGQQARLGVLGTVKRDCTAGPAPEVRVVTAPKQGALAIREGKAKAGDIKRCPKLEAPIRGVFYQANAGTSGTDEAVYEIRRADGSTQTVTVRIEIGAAAAPGGAQDATDL